MSKNCFVALCLGFAMMGAVGCQPGAYRGGGVLTSTRGEKATFGFTGQARDRDGDGAVDDVKGQFQFRDHTNGLAFDGVLQEAGVYPIRLLKFDENGQVFDENGNPVVSELAFVARGTYEPIPRNAGPGGIFEVALADWGQEGPDEGDELYVTVRSGVHQGYGRLFRIEGGNLTKTDL